MPDELATGGLTGAYPAWIGVPTVKGMAVIHQSVVRTR